MTGNSNNSNIDITVNAEPIISGLQGLGQDMQKTLLNQMSGEIADTLVQEYIDGLVENDSVVTGGGLESIESRKMGTGTYGVFMAGYLDQVDKGTTSSERKPVDENNERLIAAAEKYGMPPSLLAQTLREKGTEPHPFKKLARMRTQEQVGEKVRKIVKDSVKKNFNTV